MDPIDLLLRAIGAFYVFAGIVAGRAALLSAVMDAALAGISGNSPSLRERSLSWWLTASAWLVFLSGVLLTILAREAMWAFIPCALTQAFYLMFAAPYYFDVEDPPDEKGRRGTTNAFFIYFGATLLVIWASGSRLTSIADLHPILAGCALAAAFAFAVYLLWQSFSTGRIPSASAYDVDETPQLYDVTGQTRAFDPHEMRVELRLEDGKPSLRNQKTGEAVTVDDLAPSEILRQDLLDWLEKGDPLLSGLAHDLSERLAEECPEIAVAVPGVPNDYFGVLLRSPYEDNGAPQWDRMTAILVSSDYGCFPIWAADAGVEGDMPPSVLGLSAALEDALLAWQDRYDASLNADDFVQSHWTDAQLADHVREGIDLAQRVKRERPDLAVFVHSPRGILTVDAGSAPDQWRVRTE